MMNIHTETAMILNLCATSRFHKRHCAENCDVSLRQLEGTANYMYTCLKMRIGEKELKKEEVELIEKNLEIMKGLG